MGLQGILRIYLTESFPSAKEEGWKGSRTKRGDRTRQGALSSYSVSLLSSVQFLAKVSFYYVRREKQEMAVNELKLFVSVWFMQRRWYIMQESANLPAERDTSRAL
mgnify:CR=1 FL=1